ncbi:MAG TPA: F0F1 ATP synthase subunit epsilon [Candidatus Hydrogenedens sp.]|nr:F0F1 ATP synthase subunit epsilon [Candidatus Hydrogenedens sp.]HOK08683.1 F0F1 ATP synthase subunit epsilon [Candidatus Hydrogenedens sp.]HOL21014.1 F0F1 ATP synthase subunit epsilon [Candidatus Hydrogenedens sp.]HPP58276.1 F0F1 ATP synthase subunit epsilon [Candidatus Hydrogenedens sp.]
MSKRNLTFELCSINTQPINIESVSISLPTQNGIITILPGHTPLITSLEMGIVSVQIADDKKRFFGVMGGIAQVSQNGVSIYTNAYEEGITLPETDKGFTQWTKEIAYTKKHEEEQIKFYLLKTIKKWKTTHQLSEKTIHE